MTLKISLIIPTRERQDYLPAAVRSALTAADRAECEVEVVVSDNASQDGTPDWLAGQTDPRLKKLRSGSRLSMRENYQRALDHATGSHLVFIGDDDAVLPNGLRLAARLIRAHDPDILKWRVANYHWPDPETGTPGRLKVHPHFFDGRMARLEPASLLADFAAARFRSYQQGGMIYHGLVSRRLVERAVARSGGPYFRGSSPDVFTSLQALMAGDRPILRVNMPVTLGGTSPRSNGASGQIMAKAGERRISPEFDRFVRESAEDPYQCRLPARVPALALVTLDCLIEAARIQGVALNLDMAAWRARVAEEITGFAEPIRSDTAALAQEFFGTDFTLAPGPPAAAAAPPPPPQGKRAEAPARIRNRVGKLDLSGGPVLRDVQAAADFLDRLARPGALPAHPIGRVAALGNILRQLAGARRLFTAQGTITA